MTLAAPLPARPVDLTRIETDAAPGFDGKEADGKKALEKMGEELADLQERLFSLRAVDTKRRVLLVLQGMDTSGKGGTLRHTVGLMDPQGIKLTSFKAPTDEERTHDFLWRIEKAVPPPGFVGVFDRSHYEDVLIARVHRLVEPAVMERRYADINRFEQRMVADGTTVVKCFLHISSATQQERLLARLDDPDKQWKFNPGDVDERRRWVDYQHAYELALERCTTEQTPWYVVPSDRKWYRNWAIGQLLLETLTELDPRYPPVDFDVAEQRRRLAEA